MIPLKSGIQAGLEDHKTIFLFAAEQKQTKKFHSDNGACSHQVIFTRSAAQLCLQHVLK